MIKKQKERKTRKWTKGKAAKILQMYKKVKRGKRTLWLSARGLSTAHINHFRKRFNLK